MHRNHALWNRVTNRRPTLRLDRTQTSFLSNWDNIEIIFAIFVLKVLRMWESLSVIYYNLLITSYFEINFINRQIVLCVFQFYVNVFSMTISECLLVFSFFHVMLIGMFCFIFIHMIEHIIYIRDKTVFAFMSMITMSFCSLVFEWRCRQRCCIGKSTRLVGCRWSLYN